MSQISQSRRCSADKASLKICIVIESNSNNRYEVFLVDFDKPPTKSPCFDLGSPLFRVPLSYPSRASFFAFGSRIYFLGGSKITTDLARRSFSKDVYVWDTSSHNPTLDLVCSMNIAKFYPLVFGPFNEKFYILSHNLSDLNFEEFDPKSNSCKLLPDAPIDEQYSACGNGSNPLFYPAYCVKRYVVVNQGRKILISTQVLRVDQLGVYSYDIPNNKWGFDADKCLPFEHAVSIDKDKNIYFAYAEDREGFCTCRYNADGFWFDFRELQDDSPLYAPYFCLSLGDGRAWAIKSEYDGDIYDSYSSDPITHYIKVARFKAEEDRPADLHSVGDHSYQEEPYSCKSFRMVISSFPFLYNTADAVDPGISRSKKKSIRKNKNRNKNLEKQIQEQEEPT